MRLGPPPGGRRGPRPVLDRLHPRHGASLPQADDRAAGRVHRADLAGAVRRGALRRAAPAGDLRRAPAGCDRRGQRGRLRGGRDRRPALGADRQLQPGRGQGRGDPAVLERLPDDGSAAAGRSSSRRSARTHDELWSGFDAFMREFGRAASRQWAARPGVHPRVALPEPGPVPGRGRLPAGRSTRADLASARVLRPGDRPRAWHLPAALARGTGGRDGALLYLSLGSLGSADVGPDAAPGRHPRPRRAIG